MKQLQKYGWTDGAGLGAKEDGMCEALKPTLKFDKHGLGHDIVKDIAYNWWDDVFNKALNSNGEKADSGEDRKKEKKTYSNFVKKGIEEDKPTSSDKINTLSNEMVEECEGRTAHKGARHGIYSSGKLERLKRAEEELLQSSAVPATALKSKRLKTDSNFELTPSICRKIPSRANSKRTRTRK